MCNLNILIIQFTDCSRQLTCSLIAYEKLVKQCNVQGYGFFLHIKLSDKWKDD